VRVPVIASGGVGNLVDLVAGIKEGHATAVLAASIFTSEHTASARRSAHGGQRHPHAARHEEDERRNDQCFP